MLRIKTTWLGHNLSNFTLDQLSDDASTDKETTDGNKLHKLTSLQ